MDVHQERNMFINLVDEPDRDVAVGVIVAEDGRYLMQLRDDRAGVWLRGHWGCFGGGLDPGETPAQAIKRELFEELEITIEPTRPLGQSVFTLPYPGKSAGSPLRVLRYHFFEIPIRAADEPGFRQHEGAGRRLFALEDLVRETLVAPWDLCAILLHARGMTLFRQ